MRVAGVALDEGEDSLPEFTQVREDDREERDAFGEHSRCCEGLPHGGKKRIMLALGVLGRQDRG